MAVVNPNKKGEYILGIMCDGNRYKSAHTSRDRNILQGNVLKSLGWNIYSLWILDWWENQEKELTKIKSAIDSAIKAPEKESMTEVIKVPSLQVSSYREIDENKHMNEVKNTAEVKIESASALEDNNTKYVLCSLPNLSLGAEEFCLLQNNRIIISQIEQVLKEEAPISRNLLCKRILSSWGIARMGARLDRRFEELFLIMELNKTYSNSNTFYWNSSQEHLEYSLFRLPIDDITRRNMEDISPEEISNGIKFILQNQISLLKSDLIKEVYKLFCFSRGSSSMEEIINEGIDMAIKRNFVKVDDNERIVIVD